jgi:hypothetical protein
MRENQFVRNHTIFELMEQTGHKIAELSTAFPNKSLAEIEEILFDNRLSLRRTYERFGYLGIRECSSKNFNIGSDGARSNGAKRTLNPDVYKVHCYGGSTTVGDGVADDQTISAYLESKLNSRGKTKVAVFNYGAGNHTSLHSALRLLDHCFSGNVPDQAIFLNGFNDCYYSAGGADGIVPFFDEILKKSQDIEFRNTPISEIVELIPNSSKESLAFNASFFSGELIETCLANIKLRYASAVAIQDFVENSFGVEIRRFIEPNQALNCRTDQRLLPRINESNPRKLLVGMLYKELERIGLKKVFGYGAISLLDIDQDDQPFPLYLDRVHYSPAMNDWLASHISGIIKVKQTLSNRKKLRSTAPVAQSEELLNPNNYPLF